MTTPTNPHYASLLKTLEEFEKKFGWNQLAHNDAIKSFLESHLLSFGASEYKRGLRETAIKVDEGNMEWLKSADSTDFVKSIYESGVAEERERLRKVVEDSRIIENHPQSFMAAIVNGERGEALMEGYNKAIDSILQALSNPSK